MSETTNTGVSGCPQGETFMKALRIFSVRHLRDIEIPLGDTGRKHLILTGRNGCGKTSVLSALAKFLEYAVSTNYYSKEKLQEYISDSRRRAEGLGQTEADRLERSRFEGHQKMWESHLEPWTTGAVADFTSFADLREKYRKGEFILAFYKDNREIKVEVSKNIEKVDLKTVYPISEHPCRELVKYLVNLKTTEAFAKTSGNDARAKEIADWFARFEGILRRIYDDDALRLDFDIDTFKFTIVQSGHEPFDFSTLSMGYAAVFDIIGDLMMRMEAKRDYSLEGVVLVDEIETLLHVALQKQIMPILTDLFPNVQFVLSTHSPFILNSTPNAIVYDLETKTLAKNGLGDLPYAGIVEGYFDVDTLSQTLREKFDAYRALAEKKELTDEDFAKAAALERYLDEIPDYLAVDFSEAYERMKLELGNKR